MMRRSGSGVVQWSVGILCALAVAGCARKAVVTQEAGENSATSPVPQGAPQELAETALPPAAPTDSGAPAETGAPLDVREIKLIEDNGQPFLNMNVRFRSNDAYKAAFMNMFALIQLQQKIASRISELSGRNIKLGRYCHLADSYHIYGSYFREFEGRFLNALDRRSFEQRTMRYEDFREMMEAARPAILEKARTMGR